MRKYQTPKTDVCKVNVRTSMMDASPLNVQGNTGLRGGGTISAENQRVKDRDVWSDGYWN